MKIGCWNVKQFTTNKLMSLKSRNILAAFILEWDVAIILEGPYGRGQELATACCVHLGAGWSGSAIDTISQGTESEKDNESVLILHRSRVTLKRAEIWDIENINTGRQPVRIVVQGPSDAGAGDSIKRDIVAWHALSPGVNPYAGVDHDPIKAQNWANMTNKASSQAARRALWELDLAEEKPRRPPDVLLGDFNAGVTLGHRAAYKLASGNSPTTLKTNARFSHIQEMREAFTDNRYDRVFVREGVEHAKCGRLDLLSRTLPACGYTKTVGGEWQEGASSSNTDDSTGEGRKRRRTRETSLAQVTFEAFSTVSDHAPVQIWL